MHLIYLFILTRLVTSSCDCCGHDEYSCPEIKYVENGASGTSGLSRGWNCCKPSCASTAEAAKGNAAKQCDSYMHRLFDYSTTSKCEGGEATACFSHVPFVIDGCDDIGFGFGTLSSSNKDIWKMLLIGIYWRRRIYNKRYS